jgi:hypothetical protein
VIALAAVTLAVGAAPLARPPFTARVSRVTAADLPYSYRTGCPVAPAQLRRLRLSYWGFDDRRHVGDLVVNTAVVDDVRTVFARLYRARFPIRTMQKVDAFRGSDDASMAADNTSAFNCRSAVASGPKRWSMHAYGEAIDVNPVENPYMQGRRVLPPSGARYLNRSRVRQGMAIDGGILVRAFEEVGWSWGGRWTGSRDYQHFSTNGR